MGNHEKEKDGNPTKYIYDAFISYRHMPLDKAVAKRLQELLENIRFQKKGAKKLRIFRDQSELPTSNDLGSEIREALLQSRYLIVVCSEHTKASTWCMEEIRLFKEAHQGSTSRILTLIVSGEPNQILPEPLRWEERPVSLPTGQTALRKEILEPLSADVRAQTLKKSLRKLKVEFLRIAAPILECGFDELFQRRQRRQRRNAIIIFTGTLTLLAAVLIIVSAFAYRTKISENNYRNILVDNYTKEGNRYANSGKPQEALLYYTEALSLNPGKTSAASGAALLLQDYLWPILEEEMAGCIRNHTFLPSPYAMAGDPEKNYYLHISLKQAEVVDENGSPLDELGEDYRTFLGSSAGWWSFSGENGFLFYHPETKEKRSLPYPAESSYGCTTDPLFIDYGPNALALGDGKIIVAHNGIVHIYAFDGQGTASETARADLADAFPVDAKQQGISCKNDIYLSSDGSLALITSYSLAALYDTENLSLKAAIPRYLDDLTGMDISVDNQYFALSYGNSYRIDLANPGGCFEIYSRDGELQFSSPRNEKKALLGTAFDPANPEQLLVWGSDFVQVWNWKEGKEIMAPIRESHISSACFTEDGTLLAANKEHVVSSYMLAEFLPPADALNQGGDKLPSIRQYFMEAEGPDGMSLSLSVSDLTMTDAEGKTLAIVNLPAMGQRVALSKDYRMAYLYNINYPALMYVPVDFKAGTFGEIHQLDTGGEATLGIWFGNGWLAAETADRNLLLFNENGKQVCKIMPEHNGTIVSILTDSDIRYIACILENTTGNSHDYHFGKTGIIEIWDASSRLLLSSFEKNGREIDTASITDDGTFLWGVKGKTYARQLSIPIPDEEAIHFLQGLCCLALNANQDFIFQKPSVPDLQIGNWPFLAERAKATQDSARPSDKAGSAVSEPTFIELVNALYAAENRGSAEWFGQCDALWQHLLHKELDYTALELDYFYQAYSNPVIYAGSTNQILFGLEAYIELMENLIQKNTLSDENEPITSGFTTKIMETLAATQEYDEIIVKAFQHLADIAAEDETEITENTDNPLAETDAAIAAYTAKYLEAWAESLKGNGSQAMSALAAYVDRYLSSIPETESAVLADLYAGDAQSATDSINRWIADCLQMLSEEDIPLLSESLISYLNNSELLVWRGEIDAAIFDRYLHGIHADFGLEIVESSTAAQQAGMLPGDLIIGIDNQRIAGWQHFTRLRKQEETQSFEILRNGKTIHLTLSGPAEFYCRMAVRF